LISTALASIILVLKVKIAALEFKKFICRRAVTYETKAGAFRCHR